MIPSGAGEIARRGSWAVLGNASYAACQWLTLSVIAKLGTLDQVGQFGIGLAIAGPVMLLVDIGLRNIYVTDVTNRWHFSTYRAVRRATAVLGLALVVGVAALGDYAADAFFAIAMVGLSKAVESQIDIYYGFYQRCARLDLQARSQVLRGLVGCCALAASMKITNSLSWGLLSMTLGWSVVFLAVDRLALEKLSVGSSGALLPTIDALQGLSRLGLPLSAAAFLNSLSANIPRYMIEGSLGAAALGVFTSLAYVRAAGTTLIGSVAQAALPRLARAYIADLRRFLRELAFLLVLGGLVGVLGLAGSALLGQWFLELAYTKEISRYSDLFVWLMADAAMAYIYWCVSTGLTAARRFAAIFWLRVVLIAGVGTSSVIFVPEFGLLGAAWALLCGSTAQLVAGLVVLARVLWPVPLESNASQAVRSPHSRS